MYRENVSLLTSISNQETADAMIPPLLECRDLVPVLGLSVEPLLGPVDLSRWLACGDGTGVGNYGFRSEPIAWVIVGGESGHGARPCHPMWVRSIRDQCVQAGIAFFWKQWGEYAPLGKTSGLDPDHHYPGQDKRVSVHSGVPMDEPVSMFRIGKHLSGRLLDGRMWDEMPTAKATVPNA